MIEINGRIWDFIWVDEWELELEREMYDDDEWNGK